MVFLEDSSERNDCCVYCYLCFDVGGLLFGMVVMAYYRFFVNRMICGFGGLFVLSVV